MAKQDDYVRYTIRLPRDLYESVQEAAGEKSVNAEIAARLQASFEDTFSDAVLLERIRELVLAKRVTDLFGVGMAEEISHHAAELSDDGDWRKAIEDLLRKGIDATYGQ